MYACWLKITNRIWFTAASSGQETYSLAILLKDAAARLGGWSKKIIGTNTSSEMLNHARSGRYSQFEVQRGLAITLLVKYFIKDGVI
jgi:chemotaxis protein methyltransferase CheR